MNLNEFISYLLSHVNKSIYVWGAQGQDLKTLTDSKIRAMETSTSYANTAIKMKNARKHLEGAKAFDCSGLIMYFLQNLKGYYKSDINSNGLMGKCVKIQKSHLKKGDWLFRTKQGRAYHIGVMVSDTEFVESRGRAYGVVKRKLSSVGSYWDTFGRPEAFKDDIDTPKEQASNAAFNRQLKKGDKGNDVKELQKLINKAGDNIEVDGSFGPATQIAVKDFQRRKKLKVDGVAGKDTITALGGKWTSEIYWKVSRVLRKGSKGTDVKNMQKALIKAGYSCGAKGADGSFGSATLSAVKKFQKAKKLVVDGIAGSATITALGGDFVG